MSLCQLHACPEPCPLCDAHSVGPLVYTLNEDQWETFMHDMTHPKPPPPSMVEAARKMREWAGRPGRLEYDSWASAFDDISESPDGR